MKAHLVLGGLFLLLPSCARYSPNKEQSVIEYKQQEARNYDIPLVIDFKTQSYTSAERTLIDGTSMLSVADITQFYAIEMQRLGWEKIDVFEQNGTTKMMFEKPSKICLVIVEQRRVMLNATQQHISISASEKQRGHHDGPSRPYNLFQY